MSMSDVFKKIYTQEALRGLWCGKGMQLSKPSSGKDWIGANYPLPECECGAEKTGSNRHSTWCPCFER